jgi:hypothetical protein
MLDQHLVQRMARSRQFDLSEAVFEMIYDAGRPGTKSSGRTTEGAGSR